MPKQSVLCLILCAVAPQLGCQAEPTPEGNGVDTGTTGNVGSTTGGVSTIAATEVGASSGETDPPGATQSTVDATAETGETDDTVGTNGDQATVLFYADWSDQTGSGRDVVMDVSGEYSFGGCDRGCEVGMEVVPTEGSGFDFPTANHLQMTAYDHEFAQDGFMSLLVNGGDNDSWGGGSPYFETIEVGESLGVRYYYADTYPEQYAGFDSGNHDIEFALETDAPFNIGTNYDAAGSNLYTFDIDRLDIVDGGSGLGFSPGGTDFFPGGTDDSYLEKGQVYRIDLVVTRETATTATILAWIHDSTEALLYGPDDFLEDISSTFVPLSETTFIFDDIDANNLRAFVFGGSGIGGAFSADNDGQVVRRVAAVAFCDDYCGPYPIPGVED